MKKINLLIILSALLLNISCDSIKTAVNTATNNNPVKSKFALTDNPRNVKNAKPDAHAAEETAIIVSLLYGDTIYIGAEQYPLDTVNYKIKELIEKTPTERQLIYLNASGSLKYLSVVRIVDTLRKENIENLSLIVLPEVKTDVPFQVLKVKLMPEPKDEDISNSPDAPHKLTYLNMQKDDKISFAKYDEKYNFKLDKEEIKLEELEAKIKQLFKEREEKKIFRQGTNEIDKRIYIKATKSNGFTQIVRMIDAATGAGAEVYLQIDDLEE